MRVVLVLKRYRSRIVKACSMLKSDIRYKLKVYSPVKSFARPARYGPASIPIFEQVVSIPKANPRSWGFTIFEGKEKIGAGTNATNNPISTSMGMGETTIETKNIKKAKTAPPMIMSTSSFPNLLARYPISGLRKSEPIITMLDKKLAEATSYPLATRKSCAKVKKEMNAALNHIQAKPTSHIGFPVLDTSKITLILGSLDLGAGSLKSSKKIRRAATHTKAVKNKGTRHPRLAPIMLKTLKLVIVPKGMAVLNTPIPSPNSLCINQRESS